MGQGHLTRSNGHEFDSWLVTVGKLFTPMCLSYQAVDPSAAEFGRRRRKKKGKPKIRRKKIRLAIRRRTRENSAAAEFVIGCQNYWSFIGQILTPTHCSTYGYYLQCFANVWVRPKGNRCLSPYPQSILLLLFTEFTKIMWAAVSLQLIITHCDKLELE